MQGVPDATWVFIGVLIVIGVVTFLYALAASMAEAAKLHELKVRVAELRKSYAQRVASMSNSAPITVDLDPDQSIPFVIEAGKGNGRGSGRRAA